ncbi:hypothetical protein HBB16_19090 [Pseudonocardia sp. MCCB 268]|nr:hypothetical protein [Pseudonocardia cytotoxica]
MAFGYVPWGESASDVADLDPAGKARRRPRARVNRGAAAGRRRAGRLAPEVLSRACSSCSFLCGYEGAIRQAADLAERAVLPASSTRWRSSRPRRHSGRSGCRSPRSTARGHRGFAEFPSAPPSTVHHVAFDAPSGPGPGLVGPRPARRAGRGRRLRRRRRRARPRRRRCTRPACWPS